MKTKSEDTRTVPQFIEQLSCSRMLVCLVLGLLVVGFVKMDGTLLRVLRQSYANGFGLVGGYMREETSRTPPNVGSEVRMVTTSGS